MERSEAVESFLMNEVAIYPPKNGKMYFVQVVGQDDVVTKTVRDYCPGIPEPYNNVYREIRGPDGKVLSGLFFGL